MTGYTVHTGASKKFVSGWDNVFSKDSPTNKPEDKKKKTTEKAAARSKTKKTKK